MIEDATVEQDVPPLAMLILRAARQDRSDNFSKLSLMSQMEKKTLSAPDEKRSFDKGQLELVTLGGVTFGRATLRPGWKWSTCVKPWKKRSRTRTTTAT
jgi:hypothetical protein